MKRILLILPMLLTAFHGYAQFKANMQMSTAGTDVVYTVYSDNTQYRYEFNQNNQPMILIIKPQANTTLMLFPAQKFYMKMTGDNMMDQGGSDPLKNYDLMKKTCIEKVEGKETVEGYVCEKRVLSTDGKKMMTVWYSDDLKFPLKMVDHKANLTMTLKDIKKWDPNPAFFEVPENYTSMLR